MSSVLIGGSRPEQVVDCARAVWLARVWRALGSEERGAGLMRYVVRTTAGEGRVGLGFGVCGRGSLVSGNVVLY